MSYILDALRRADAERERGEVPGLQSQQQHAGFDDEEARPRRNPMLLVIAALVLALAAAIGWNFIGGEPARPRSPGDGVATAAAPALSGGAAPAATPTATTTATAPLALPNAPVAATAPSLALAPVPATAPAPQALAPMAQPTAAVEAVRAAAEAKRATARRATAASAAPALAAGPAGSQAGRGGPESRIFAASELPEDIRRELPRITIGGASYSNDAASRMVIINGQVFHEGDKVSNGLVLEKIKLKAAVLAYKGWRYQLDY